MATPHVYSPRSRRTARLFRVLRGRFALLFFFLLASIVVYPYAENSGVGFYAFRIVGLAVILLTVHAVAFSRGVLAVVIVLAIFSTLQHVILPIHAGGIFPLIARSLSLVFDLLVITLIFVHVFQTDKPDSETIFGALCVYVLLGFTFAGIYSTIYSVARDAFVLPASANLHIAPDRFDFIYYSFGTLTESGAPGITAVAPVARSVSLLEAISGILYLAVLISRLLSAYRTVEVTDPDI